LLWAGAVNNKLFHFLIKRPANRWPFVFEPGSASALRKRRRKVTPGIFPFRGLVVPRFFIAR
jgi:hypothetical protein